jgi:hypothetical protein
MEEQILLLTLNGVGNPAIGKGEAGHSEYLAFERLSELTHLLIQMDCSFSLKDEN